MDFKLEVVPIPVSDVDRARRFYADRVGFVVDHDTRVGDMHFVQLTPPGSGCSIVIGAPSGMKPGSVEGVQLVVDDIDAARSHLEERGVAVSPVRHMNAGGEWEDGPGGRWNSFVFFSDPDGNRWVLQERPPGE